MRSLAAVSVALCAALAGCAPPSQARPAPATAPRSLARAPSAELPVADSLDGLAEPGAPERFFVLSRGAAWNAAVTALQRATTLEWADPTAGTIATAWRFSSRLSADRLLAEQTSERTVLRMGASNDFAAAVEARRRTRAVCAEATPWAPVESSRETDAASIAARAVQERLRGGWEDVRFVRVEDALARVGAALSPYTVASTEFQTITTEWHETHDPEAPARRTRSRLRIRMLDAEPDRVRFEVGAELERGSDAAGWTSGDPSRVVAHGWAVLERTLEPSTTTLPDETPIALRNAASTAPTLDAPTDTGIGRFDVLVSFEASESKPDGSSWDGDRLLGELVRHAPELVRFGHALYSGGATEIAGAALQAVGSFITGGSGGGVEMRLGRMLSETAARRFEQTFAPDPYIVLSRPRRDANGRTAWAPWVELPVVADTHAAVWAPITVTLDGQRTPVRFRAVDRDVQSDDGIASGTIDLLEPTRTCEHVRVETPGGTLRVIAVRRSEGAATRR